MTAKIHYSKAIPSAKDVRPDGVSFLDDFLGFSFFLSVLFDDIDIAKKLPFKATKMSPEFFNFFLARDEPFEGEFDEGEVKNDDGDTKEPKLPTKNKKEKRIGN